MTKVGKVLIIAGVSLGLLGLAGAVMWNGVGDGGIAREKARAVKLGLPQRPNDAVPNVAPERNAGPILAKLGEDLSVWRNSAGKNPMDSDGPSDADLKALDPIIQASIRASKLPECSFQKDFEQGPAMMFPELANLKAVVKLLQADALRLARAGQTDAAFERLQAGARISALLGKSEPTVIASLVQISLSSIVIRAVQNTLNETGTGKAALDGAERTLSDLGELPSIKRAMVGEWALGGLALENVSPEELRSWFGMGEAPTMEPSQESMVLEAAFSVPSMRKKMIAHYLDTFLDFYEALPTDAKDFRTGMQVSDNLAANLEKDKSIDGTLSRIMFPVFGQTYEAVGRDLANRRVLRNLIAALRTSSNQLPNLGEESKDPFSSGKLTFDRQGGTVTVYSVGTNGVDDGGEVLRLADVVARYPWVNPEPAPGSPLGGPPGGPPVGPPGATVP